MRFLPKTARRAAWLAPLVAPLFFGACNNSDGHGNGFDPLVTNLIVNETSDTSEPVEVEGQTFNFPTSDTAFDDVLPPDTGSVVD